MKFEQMVKKYPDEWLIIEVKKFNSKTLKIEDGKVLLHTSKAAEIYNTLLKFKGRNLSIEYTGKAPKDMAVLL